MQRLITILMTIMAIGLLATATPVLAQATDYEQCDGFKGPALGLCKAGVALGCDSDPGDPACANIEETFQIISGVEPPWALFSCPCWAGSTVGEWTSMVDAWVNTAGYADIVWCSLRGAQDDPLYDYAWITVLDGPNWVAGMWAGIAVEPGPGESNECGRYGYGGDCTQHTCFAEITDATAENCMAEIDQVIAASPACQ